MNPRFNRVWFLAACIVAVIVTIYVLPFLVTKPGGINLELGGDASKNYFTYLYHSLYGRGIWFTGMNYPYGEHVVFVDGQPILSSTLGYLRDTLGLTQSNMLAILHLLIALSFFLAIVYTYKILRSFEVLPWLAIVFAPFIITMSPQLFRVFGHFGLSYFCIIPIIFYWTIRYHKTGGILYPVLFFFLGLIASFLHPYFGAVILIWTCFYCIGYLLLHKGSKSQKFREVAPLLFSGVLVFAVVRIIMLLTDPVNDRPISPIGLLGNGTTGEDVLMSSMSPLWQQIAAWFPAIKFKDMGEGYSYIGIATIVIVLLSIASMVRKRKHQGTDDLVSIKNFDPVWFFIIVASLLLGMGVPFVWGMDWLLDIVPAFKQFRSMGRFSWIFYYVVTIFAAVAINYWFVRTYRIKRLQSIVVLVICIIIWGIDSYGYARFARGRQAESTKRYSAFFESDNWKQFLSGHQYHSTDFKAALLVPFYHIGTEKFTLNEKMDWAFTVAMRMSLQLQLPLIDAMMSRSSWSQASTNARLVGGPFTNKPILDTIDKPFLLLHYYDTPLDRNTEYLLKAADFIDTFSLFKVYACYPDRLIAMDKYVADSIANYSSLLNGNDTCIGCQTEYFINHFDTGKSGQLFLGTKAANVIPEKQAYVAEFNLEQSLQQDNEYEFSSWVLVKRENHKIPYFILDVFDSNNAIVVRHHIGFKPVDNYGLWYRVANFINLPQGTKAVKCMIINEDGPNYAALDEILLAPSNAVVLSRFTNGQVMVNNHIYKR